MASRNKIIQIIAICIILVSCRQDINSVIPTRTDSPIRQATQTPAQPVDTPTNSPSPTPSFTITLTPTKKFTTTPTPSPTPIITLPELKGDPTNYKLSLSDPETLIKIKREYTSQSFRIPWGVDVIGLPTTLLDSVIAYEWRRSYSSKADSQLLFDLLPLNFNEGYVSDQILIDVIGDVATSFFNEEKTIFQHNSYFEIPKYHFFGHSYEVQIDKDNSPEWLIEINDYNYLNNGSIWLTLDQNEDSIYSRMVNELPRFWGFSRIDNPEFQFRDLSGDGVMDVVIEEIMCGAGQCISTYHVIIGGSDGFHNTESTARSESNEGGANNYWSEGSWSISQENNLPILEITNFRDLNPWDCIVSSKKTFQWVGNNERIIDYPVKFPDTAICALAYAIDNGAPLTNKERIQLLNLAYNHSERLSAEYQVYTLFRLALLHSLEEEDWAARKYLKLLSQFAQDENTPVAKYLVEQTQPLLRGKEVQPYKLCLAAESILQISDQTPFSFYGGFETYPYKGFNEGYPSALCNTLDIQEEALALITRQSNQFMNSMLEEAGFQVIFSVPFEFSVTPSAWIIAIEDHDPTLKFYSESQDDELVTIFGYSNDFGWKKLISIFTSSFAKPYYQTEDLTGDGVPDFALLLQENSSSGCGGDDLYSISLLVTQVTNRLVWFQGTSFDSLCSPKFETIDILNFLADANQDGNVDWIVQTLTDDNYDLELPYNNTDPSGFVNFFSLTGPKPFVHKPEVLEEISNQVFESANPKNLRDEIIFYRDRWGTEDDLGRETRAMLDYLLALTYESEGEDLLAIEIFYKIWEDQPETFWAHLAASRLDYVP